MRLYAISDLHVRAPQNRTFVEHIAPHPRDWLILGGDIGESAADLRFVLETLGPKFAQIVWVPGNHELWTVDKDGLRGEARYLELVRLCREFGVLTPEDPFARWPGEGPPTVIVPMFLLYDYTFRPEEIPPERAVAWAAEQDIVCTDEYLLHPDPHPSRPAWCEARCRQTEARLQAIPADVGTILVNHFPLRAELAWLPLVPRFSVWCGTTRTTDWHTRYRARAVVFGHLHIRQRRVIDHVPFYEVSLGHPKQWKPENQTHYLRQIWPPPTV